MKSGAHRVYEMNVKAEFSDDAVLSSGLSEEMRATFGALRQLTKEVKDILAVTNRELNEAVLWNLGPGWCGVDDSPKRPAEMRTLMQRGKQSYSGSIGRSGGRSPR